MAGSLRARALGVAAAAAMVLNIFSAGPVRASDDVLKLPVSDGLTSPDAQKLDGSVAFYFGNTPHPAVLQSFGSFVSNKKSNAFGKKDTKSCNRAFASTLITFQKRAKALGANAVINIHSYYDKNDVSYDKEFECHSGFLMSGVALKGDVVKLKK